MGLFDNWPYSDVHQLNLDWILKVIKEIKGKADLIDESVETAQTAAENASASEVNAAASKDDAAAAAVQAQNYYNQILYLTGSAVIANSAADMDDTDKVYIYVGSEEGYEHNHWYYYDGTSWVDGGLYGAGTGISGNASNILKYILERVAYTETGMQVYIDALYQALTRTPSEEPPTPVYSITNALVNVNTSSDVFEVAEGDSYSAILTADTDYRIDSVTVTMGDADITTQAYNQGTGAITIASVTGNVVITATAVSVAIGVMSATQGNLTTQSSETDRVTIVLNQIDFAPLQSFTISVSSDYSLFAFAMSGITDINNAGTRNTNNRINVYAIGSNGYVQNGIEVNSRISISESGWEQTKTYTNTSETISMEVTGIGFMIKTSDGSALTPEEAVSLYTISY